MSVAQRTLLMEVADIFDVPSYGGLVLAPAPAMPAHGFVARRCQATLEFPDGSVKEREVFLNPTHFKLLSGGSDWRVVVVVPGAHKADVPIGTRVFVNQDLAHELVPVA